MTNSDIINIIVFDILLDYQKVISNTLKSSIKEMDIDGDHSLSVLFDSPNDLTYTQDMAVMEINKHQCEVQDELEVLPLCQ